MEPRCRLLRAGAQPLQRYVTRTTSLDKEDFDLLLEKKEVFSSEPPWTPPAPPTRIPTARTPRQHLPAAAEGSDCERAPLAWPESL